jgi:site-specific DNA recombinase
MNDNLSAAIYVRVSTTKQVDDGISIDSQTNLLTEYCNENKYTIYNIYVDAGKSGTSINKRNEFKKLIEDAKQKKFNVLLIWKISRFGRNFNDLIYGSKILLDNNISIVSYSENFDLNTAIGRLIFNILASIANYEIDEYSENIRMVFDQKAKRGGRMCHFVLGYDTLGKDSFSVNTYEAYIVVTIFKVYLLKKNLTHTANYLNDLGFVGKRGKPFSTFSIRHILRSSLYCGYIEHNSYIYKGHFQHIINIDMFNAVQIILYKNRKPTAKDVLYIIENDKKIKLNDDVTLCYDEC